MFIIILTPDIDQFYKMESFGDRYIEAHLKNYYIPKEFFNMSWIRDIDFYFINGGIYSIMSPAINHHSCNWNNFNNLERISYIDSGLTYLDYYTDKLFIKVKKSHRCYF